MSWTLDLGPSMFDLWNCGEMRSGKGLMYKDGIEQIAGMLMSIARVERMIAERGKNCP